MFGIGRWRFADERGCAILALKRATRRELMSNFEWDHSEVVIRRAEPVDFDAIWEIFHRVVAAADTYAFAPDSSREEAKAIWMNEQLRTYVARHRDRIVGTYILRPNQPGLGSHVANAAYMVHPDRQGQGLGEVLCEDSLNQARKLGFLAMQFNFVVSTNQRAIALWQKCGFEIVGTLPKAFRHTNLGLVDAYVMHRFL